MSDTTDTTDATPWHESIQAYRHRGAEPADHPAREFLTEIAGRIRWTESKEELASAEERLAQQGTRTSTDHRAESRVRWTIELLSDQGLADWFIDGLDDDLVQREEALALDAWHRQARPWDAEVVPIREGFRCDISGRADRVVALRLSPRVALDAEPLHLDVATVMSVCEHGLADLEAALGAAVTDP